MSNTLAFVRGNNLFTTSSIISVGVQIEHRAVLQLIKKYIDKLKTFGDVLFETESLKTAGGNQKREIAVLNEPQTTLLLTFFKNTEIVVNFKLALVQTFYELKERLNQNEQDTSLITPEQQYEISSHVMRKTHALFGRRNYSAVYQILKRRFRIPRYTCLLQRDYETALKFIDGLIIADFNLPDVQEKASPVEMPSIYVSQSDEFTFNLFPATQQQANKLTIMPDEFQAIKSLVYCYGELFKPLIQWAAVEALKQNHPQASRFYDVWHEPLWFLGRMKRLIERNS